MFSYENLLGTLWDIVESLLEIIGAVWDFLSSPLVITIEWFKIPLILPDGINISTGIVPLEFFGIGIFVFLILWAIKGLIPML